MLRLTVKNYRCFSDELPGIVDFGPGFTSFVGTNNSGKSSFLRLFHEFRDVFEKLTAANNYDPRQMNFAPANIDDWHEIFHNRNNRNAVVEIENTAPHPGVRKIRLLFDRSQSNHARLDVSVQSPSGELVQATNQVGPDTFNIPGINSITASVEAFTEFAKTISQSFYVGPFRNAITEGSGNYYDIRIGTSSIEQWDQWKTGPLRAPNEAAQRVTDDIGRIFDFPHFEINASSDKKTLQVIANRKPYRLRELGAGLAQFIIVFGNVAMRKPSLLLIDEPELNLHPSLQMDFLTSLASYTSQGVILASHSIGLARSVSERIYSFQHNGEHSIVRPFEQIPNYAEFVGELSFSSFQDLGCDRVLLVEGVTEVKAIQQFLRALRMDHTTVLLPLGGRQMIRGGVPVELRELGRLSKNIAVLIDSERRQKGAALTAERAAFVKDCQKLKLNVHVTERRAFENYLSENAVREERGKNVRSLTAYESLSDLENAWPKGDNWRIARRMSQKEILETDVGVFLKKLKSAKLKR